MLSWKPRCTCDGIVLYELVAGEFVHVPQRAPNGEVVRPGCGGVIVLEQPAECMDCGAELVNANAGNPRCVLCSLKATLQVIDCARAAGDATTYVGAEDEAAMRWFINTVEEENP